MKTLMILLWIVLVLSVIGGLLVRVLTGIVPAL
jgi:hypothetical protein